MRTRAAAADLSGAARSGPPRARLLSAAALARELYAWPLALWTLIPLLIGWTGAFPLSCSPVLFVALLGGAASGRWSATRLVHGVGLHPVHDARASAYDAPGSLLALPSAASRRILPRRVSIPDQPLLWAALILTFATPVLLVERSATSDAGANIAAGAAVVNLVLLWMFALRAIGKRGWDRTMYRLAVDLPVTLDGRPARIVEASPTGIAVAGDFADVVVGSPATVRMHRPNGREVALRSVVANRRHGPGRDVLGLSLRLEPDEYFDWVADLFAVAGNLPALRSPRGTAHIATRVREGRSAVRSLAFRLEMLLVGAISVFAAGVLVIVLLGMRPLVISSGSMRPTLRVGEVVVTNWVRADRFRVGDIVSFDDRAGTKLLVTHRVRRIVVDGDLVHFENAWRCEHGQRDLGRPGHDAPAADGVEGPVPRPGTLRARLDGRPRLGPGGGGGRDRRVRARPTPVAPARGYHAA